MKEIEVMGIIANALEGLDDPVMCKRILRWVNDRFSVGAITLSDVTAGGVEYVENDASHANASSLNGVAMMTQNGELKITARDLKGKGINDTAVRLAHVVLYSYRALTSEKWVSSRKILTPILKDHRVYTGNSRTALSQCKGIVRDGDMLTLDVLAQADAERFIEEIKA